ncbi:AraC family transcriptional regulator [Leptolyngbya sp. 7M]|uniref:AraC family transcriptional regulator n=1 Tax=Leptolyngbya sp. 7M TaxID=2812896 RepID=UPI001B8C2B90|nr:AraC family transcriptional regulator [Leptolyngbya sp. 7M]QYO67891.1 AraC family transcriptional regulator [Leptolyngbya sp. 7M]
MNVSTKTGTPHIPLIRANVLKGFVTFLEEIGSPTQHLLVNAKLPPSALHKTESLLPFKQVIEFYAKAAYEAGCEYFGLLVGQRTQIADLGAYGRLLCQSLTLHDAINKGIHMIPTYTSGEWYWLEEQGERVWLCRNFVHGLDAGLQHADHFSVMLSINLIRMAAGQQWRPTEVHFKTQHAPGLKSFEPLANAKIHFEQPATAIVFPRSLLSLPLQNKGNHQDIQRYKDYELLHSSAPATSFSGSIRQVIAPLLREQQTDIQVAAELAGMSVRTFQRQLHDLDLTYSRLLDQVRFEQSLRLLLDPDIKLVNIASELGYTDAANFTRAFKRWTGLSPTEFRHLRWKM